MKVLITPRSFGKTNPNLFKALENAGFEIIRNETGGILDEKQMIELIAPCDAVILGVDPLNASVINAAPNLKVVSRYGVGLDNIDLGLCQSRGIKVYRTEGAIENAVADYAFALMLGVARRICEIDRRCREKDWSKITSLDIFGKTLGIIGLGAVGKCVAHRAYGFNMPMLAADIHWDESFASKYDIVQADVDRICRESDFISVHCSLDECSRNIVNKRRIEMMKPTAILINTSRGELVEEDALLDALVNKRIYGAGIDVFVHEPPQDPRWYTLDNVILGNHCSSSTRGATELMGALSVENLLEGFKYEIL